MRGGIPLQRVRVVCTDRDQHPKRRVGWLYFIPPDELYPEPAVGFDRWAKLHLGNAAQGPPEDRVSEGGTLTLPCQACGRNVPLNQRRALRLFDGETPKVVELDISLC